jgi:hypothetical protein
MEVTAVVTPEATSVEMAEATSATTAETTAAATEQASPTTGLFQSLAMALSQEPSLTETVEASTTVAPSNTARPTATDTAAPTATDTATPGPTDTVSPTPTDTPIPIATYTMTFTPLPATEVVTEAIIVAPETTVTTAPPTATDTRAPEIASVPTGPAPLPGTIASGGGRLPIEAIVGGLGLFIVIGYAGLYWRGILQTERYTRGFIVKRCPVCREGRLEIETRYERSLGIPRARRTVRCTNCRSVLRETGNHQWRYAIDPFVSPALYARYNGRIVDDETLKKLTKEAPLASQPPRPRDVPKPPTFVDDDRE